MNQPDGLIKVLLNLTASVSERDDAAMDLHRYPGKETEDALFQIASDPETPDTIASSAGESLAQLWILRGTYDPSRFSLLVPLAKEEANTLLCEAGIPEGNVPKRSFKKKVKRWLHNVSERLKSRQEGRTSTVYEIEWDANDFRVKWRTVENETGVTTVDWNSVSAVDTYKEDQWVVDCIVLAFETPDGWAEVNEDMRNWTEFLAVLPKRLPGFPPREKWFNKVMLPPFETNHMSLWTKK